MLKMKTMLMILVSCCLIIVNTTTIHASYNYNDWSQPVPSMDGYVVKEQGIISGTDIDVTVDSDEELVTLSNIEDFFVTEDYYYIVDSAIARVVILDKTFQVQHIISDFPFNGVTQPFLQPTGIYVTEHNELYVTDFEMQKIIVFDENYNLINVISKPNNPTFGNREFKVKKIVLDRTNRIYVTVGNVYDGIVEMTSDGEFSRFFGVQQVQTNPLDLLWRRFMTQEQLEKTVLFLPVEYTNMAIDSEGFIYATATSESATPIQRLNPKGSDVLRKNGYVDPIGDIVRLPNQEKSNFVSIAVNDYGMYSALDRENRKIFTYNDEGYLLYVTGMEGEYEGMFKYPTAVVYDDENIIVTDSELNTITVFEPTEFGSKVNEAIELSYLGEYLNITELWEEIIEENANFSYAYVGIGNALFRDKDYKGAMAAYQLGYDKEGYGKAYKQYRKLLLRDNFPIIGFGAMAVIAIVVIRPIVKDIGKKEDDK